MAYGPAFRLLYAEANNGPAKWGHVACFIGLLLDGIEEEGECFRYVVFVEEIVSLRRVF